MSAAPYNDDGQWDIPGFLWPAVLGTSVAIHISVLIYGLPDMSFLPDEPVPQHETEVIIESGGLTFAPVPAVESEASQTAVPGAAPVVSSSATPQPVLPAPVVSARPVEGDALQPVKPEASRPDRPQPSKAPVLQAVAAAKPQASPVATAPVVPAQQPQTLTALRPVDQTLTPAQQVAVAEPGPVARAGAAQVGGRIVKPAVSLVSPVTGPPSGNAEAPEPVPQNSNVRPAQDSVALVAAPSAPKAAVSAPKKLVPVSGARVGAVGTGGAVSGSGQTGTGPVQAVRPVEQQIATLRPAEEDVTAIDPARPEISAVPAAPQTSEPAQGVAPVEVASIDPLAKVSGYVASYDPGDCAHLTVMSAGADSAAVTAYGAGIAPFAIFDQRFAADQGYEAKIEVRLVTREQCALLNALGVSEGVEAAGLVELDRTIVASGTRVSGVVQRDLPLDRIAAAEGTGVSLNGKGPPELYLIDDGGQIHDGRAYILPASNALTAGGWRFSVPVTLLSKQESETALLLAIWNRPEDRQPEGFSSLPADRVAEVLSAPGVYSLTAFKVTR
ncbi:hypothetical protein [Labrenzia sp. 011]|uniref:hypothetical protein n=1 Tax=Labrenzia sp. 011 TaxID=2171494 RepID=UPI000D50D81A|nr:hypothetical protein [Labrenzia sp. 011]PVB63595.1 hypothetical protein DCO57_02035 [Labrenzia sp. 011]